MDILVFTPDHLLRSAQEKTLADLRADFSLKQMTDMQFISARQTVGVRHWDELGQMLMQEEDLWSCVLVPFNLGAEGLGQVELQNDLKAMMTFARRLGRPNVVVHLSGAPDKISSFRLAALDAGILFVHQPGDNAGMLRAMLMSAARMTPLRGQTLVTVGPLSFDSLNKRLSVMGKPVKLSLPETRLISALALRQGMSQNREDLAALVDDEESGAGAFDTILSRLRKKIDAHADDDAMGQRLIRTLPRAGLKLITEGEFLAAQSTATARLVDIGWFTLEKYPDGRSGPKDTKMIFNEQETRVLLFLYANKGETVSPAMMGAALYPGGNGGYIRAGKILAGLRRKMAQEAFSGCIVDGHGNDAAFVPFGSTPEIVDALNAYRNIRVRNFGWFALEVSSQFDPYKKKPAARIEGTSYILKPSVYDALCLAYDRHGQFLSRESVSGANTPANLRDELFRRYLGYARDIFEQAGLKPERFIKHHGNRVRFFRHGVTYDENAEPVREIKLPKTEKIKTIDAGGWMNVDIFKNHVGVITGTKIVLYPSLTKMFEYAVARPLELLTPEHGVAVFPDSPDPAVTFTSAMNHLRDVLKANGYPKAFTGMRGRGTFFCPKDQTHRIPALVEAFMAQTPGSAAKKVEIEPPVAAPKPLRLRA